MLEGTDLFSAYQPMSSMSPYENSYASTADLQPEAKHEPETPSRKQVQAQSLHVAPIKQHTPQQDMHTTGVMYDANIFNKQYEQEQRIVHALNEIRRRKEESFPQTSQPSYFDKLFSKKRELAKLLQFALIIVLGLSIHYVIDHYLKNYIAEQDIPFERQLFLRLLYPFAVLFVLWNLKVFVK